MVGLNTVFKQVFGEGLKEEGFVKIKGRQPYLVRVVEGGEIIHILTCRNEWCGERGYKAFTIYGTVATVYRDSIDLTQSPSQNINWFEAISDIYYNKDMMACDEQYRQEIFSFVYMQDDEDSLHNEMERALGETKKVMLSVFDKAVTLEACIEYCRRYASLVHEFLLYIKTDNHDDFIEENKKRLAEKIKAIEEGKLFGNVEVVRKNIEDWRIDTITQRDQIYNDPELYASTWAELEQRKVANTEALRLLGVKI